MTRVEATKAYKASSVAFKHFIKNVSLIKEKKNISGNNYNNTERE